MATTRNRIVASVQIWSDTVRFDIVARCKVCDKCFIRSAGKPGEDVCQNCKMRCAIDAAPQISSSSTGVSVVESADGRASAMGGDR